MAVNGFAVPLATAPSTAASSTLRVVTESEYRKVLDDAGFSTLVAMDYATFCKTPDKDLPVRTPTFHAPDVFCLCFFFCFFQSVDITCMTLIFNPLSLRRLKNFRVHGARNKDLWFNDENVDGAHASIIMEFPAPQSSKRRIKSPGVLPWRRMVAVYCGYTRPIVLRLEESNYQRYVFPSAGNAPIILPGWMQATRPPARALPG